MRVHSQTLLYCVYDTSLWYLLCLRFLPHLGCMCYWSHQSLIDVKSWHITETHNIRSECAEDYFKHTKTNKRATAITTHHTAYKWRGGSRYINRFCLLYWKIFSSYCSTDKYPHTIKANKCAYAWRASFNIKTLVHSSSTM